MTRFLTILCALAMLAGSAVAQVQTWNIDPNHTAAQFSVRHMGISTVRGAFTKVSGTAQYDPSNPSKTSVDATIEAASVDTRVSMRDDDLRSDHYFDAAKYPTITFKSKVGRGGRCRQAEDHRRSDNSRNDQAGRAGRRWSERSGNGSAWQLSRRSISQHHRQTNRFRCWWREPDGR